MPVLLFRLNSITFCPITLLRFLFYYIHGYYTCGTPSEISSKSSNLPFVFPLRYSSFRRLSYILYTWFSKHPFTCVSQSFMSGINNISPPSLTFYNSLFYSGFITVTYLVRLTLLALRFCIYPIVDIAAPSVRRETYEALQFSWYFTILN